ncbi:MAG: alginate lyase family protein [Betaproteobacteria bacterium]
MSDPDRAGGVLHTPGRAAFRAVTRLGWYFNRLRCMTPAELNHRLFQAARVRAEAWQRIRLLDVPAARLTASCQPWFHMPPAADVTGCVAAADRVVAGRFDLFALRDIGLGTPPCWNRDPRTGVEAPLRYGKLLNYRDERLVGDIKYLWELNRHAHLVTLAQAYALTRERRYFDVLRLHLESWLAACPFPLGPNWSSALEAGLRLINWSTSWQLLGGASAGILAETEHADFRSAWLRSVYQHASFIHGYFSRYSSANNHLIGEAAGLYIAALTWPHWQQADRWRTEAKHILEREALLQNGEDGVNLEQAVAYQRFELELLILCWRAAEANGDAYSAPFQTRIEAMLEFLASIMDVNGNVPMIGDSDDAVVVRLDHRPRHCGFRSLLASGSLLFRRPEFKKKAGELDERTRWLIKDAERLYRALDTSNVRLPVRYSFPQGGYYVLGCDLETPREIRLVADAGPLGYQAIAAHGHADALSFTLSVGGLEFFVDPGTYAYHTRENWRRYFRGTAAHNTLRIDSRDQSQPGGNFMWLKKAHAACRRWSREEDRDIFEGWHDGYRDLPDPVVHRRRITLEKRARRFVIEDVLEAQGAHTVELFLHCSDACRIRDIPQGYLVSRGSRHLRVSLPTTAEPAERHVLHGSINPIHGWISRRFDEKEAIATLVWRARITGGARLRWEIQCHP